MSELYLMVTITDRDKARKFHEFYKEKGLEVLLASLAFGTATSKTLDTFGLEASDKAVIFSVLTNEFWTDIKKSLYHDMQIDIPGAGVAFTIPLSSIGGKRELYFLTQNQNFEKGEESNMKDTKFELLVIISNQGYVELIMDAAREAGAAGGTVFHAKGTGMESAQKFFGVNIAAEKEMTFIVTTKEQKNSIMSAIMEKAGMESKAKSIVFSLPVTSTAGLRTLDEYMSS